MEEKVLWPWNEWKLRRIDVVEDGSKGPLKEGIEETYPARSKVEFSVWGRSQPEVCLMIKERAGITPPSASFKAPTLALI
ncbi:hypothetical protein SK128_010998 [Halocaridina rubra]|uniref:Uncharacterized protein n=1 Tax=Halocaridina rubra TaxID=373956 RepID=A0AAN8WMH6_HALRR